MNRPAAATSTARDAVSLTYLALKLIIYFILALVPLDIVVIAYQQF